MLDGLGGAIFGRNADCLHQNILGIIQIDVKPVHNYKLALMLHENHGLAFFILCNAQNAWKIQRAPNAKSQAIGGVLNVCTQKHSMHHGKILELKRMIFGIFRILSDQDPLVPDRFCRGLNVLAEGMLVTRLLETNGRLLQTGVLTRQKVKHGRINARGLLKRKAPHLFTTLKNVSNF